MAEIFVCKPGAISEEDRLSLREAGVVVVQMDDPSAFRLIRSTSEIESDAFVHAAIAALSPYNDDKNFPADVNRRAFFRFLADAETAARATARAGGA